MAPACYRPVPLLAPRVAQRGGIGLCGAKSILESGQAESDGGTGRIADTFDGMTEPIDESARQDGSSLSKTHCFIELCGIRVFREIVYIDWEPVLSCRYRTGREPNGKGTGKMATKKNIEALASKLMTADDEIYSEMHITKVTSFESPEFAARAAAKAVRAIRSGDYTVADIEAAADMLDTENFHRMARALRFVIEENKPYDFV